MTDEEKLLEKVNKEATDASFKSATEAVNKFTEEYKGLVTKAAEGKMTRAEVDEELRKLETKSQEFTNLQLKSVSEKLEQVTEDLKKSNLLVKSLNEKNIVSAPEKSGFGTLFVKSLEKEGLIEEHVLDQMTGKKAIALKNWNKNERLDLKVAFDMTTALTQLPGSTPGTSIGYLTDYGKMQDVQINLNKDQHVTQFLPTDPITGEFMGVLVEYDFTDGADVVTEGNPAAKSALKFKTIEYKVLDYSTRVRVHKNMMRDMPRLESKLNRIIPDAILGSLDAAVFSTTGDNSTTAWGMYYSGNYTAFSYSAALGDKVKSATIINLVGKMVLQAELLNQDVNTVIIHPSLLNGLRHEKDELGNSLTDRNIVFNSAGQVVSIWGLNVVLNKKQTVDRLTVMWNQAYEIGILEDVSFEIGTDADDFSKGYRTIIFSMRAALGVGKPGAIIVSSDVTGDLSTINLV